MTLTLADIQRINIMSIREHLTVQMIAEQTEYSLEDIDAVCRGVYVEDLRAQFKPDADITMQEYLAIRKRWKPANLSSLDSEHAIARDMLIDPKTVLRIARSQFSNNHTHPVAANAVVLSKPANESRAITEDDVARIRKLKRNAWRPAEIAIELDVPVALVAHVTSLSNRSWLPGDIVIDCNRKFKRPAATPKAKGGKGADV